MAENMTTDDGAREDRGVTRDVTIQLRVTQAEHDAMKAAAEAEGLTLSEWIRKRCIKVTTKIEAVYTRADVIRAHDPAVTQEQIKVSRARLRKQLAKKRRS